MQIVHHRRFKENKSLRALKAGIPCGTSSWVNMKPRIATSRTNEQPAKIENEL